jgi:hypothetical protein
VAPWLTRTALRRRRWAVATNASATAEAGWRELRDTALDLRLPWDDSVTLRTRARALASAFGPTSEERVRGVRGAEGTPHAAAALDRLVLDVERARYARDGSADRGRSTSAVRQDVEVCADALRAGTTKKSRRAATWLPASLVRNGGLRSLLAQRPQKATAEAGMDRAC